MTVASPLSKVRSARAIGRDVRGVALVEFAIILPFLLFLYLGSFQLEDGIACYRKVTITTRAAADLVSQSLTGSTTANEVDGDLKASTQILAPYSSANAVVRVTEVGTDSNLKTTVQWSRATDGSGYQKGAVATIPAAMKLPGTYFIFSEVKYSYVPGTSYGFVNAMTFSDSLYMLPRNSNSVDCPTC